MFLLWRPSLPEQKIALSVTSVGSSEAGETKMINSISIYLSQSPQRGIAATKLHYNRQILSLTELAETAEKYPFCRSREFPTGKNIFSRREENKDFMSLVLAYFAQRQVFCSGCRLCRSKNLELSVNSVGSSEAGERSSWFCLRQFSEFER